MSTLRFICTLAILCWSWSIAGAQQAEPSDEFYAELEQALVPIAERAVKEGKGVWIPCKVDGKPIDKTSVVRIDDAAINQQLEDLTNQQARERLHMNGFGFLPGTTSTNPSLVLALFLTYGNWGVSNSTNQKFNLLGQSVRETPHNLSTALSMKPRTSKAWIVRPIIVPSKSTIEITTLIFYPWWIALVVGIFVVPPIVQKWRRRRLVKATVEQLVQPRRITRR